jgi:NADH-quinone oxidoreductase subunit M
MLHAGALKKFGLYALIRIALPLLPEARATWMPVLAWLCLGNLVYCGWVAMRQKDFNWLIGYSSVAHMGFVFLGIASLTVAGVTGAVLVMIAHGFLAALTFGLNGYIYQQTGTLQMDQLGGLLRRLPFIGTALLMAAFAGCGLPGFANFAGEVTVLFGAWKPLPHATVFAAWGALIIGAVYMLRAMRKILHGPLPQKWGAVVDASDPWRRTPFVLLLACLIMFGCVPRLLTDKIGPSAENIVSTTAARPDTEHAPQAAARAPTRSAMERTPHPIPLPFGRGEGEASAGRIPLEVYEQEATAGLFSRPSGTCGEDPAGPGIEMPGYFRASLRDEAPIFSELSIHQP